jgi:Sec-independent protein translocase protein TatA
MTQARRSHEPKTLTDRQRYFKTTVHGAAGPTLDEPLTDTDSTDAVSRTEQEYIGPYQSTKPPSRLLHHLREKWPELLVALLIPILGFGAYQLYMLNREVGELRIEVTDTRNRQQQLQEQLERTETRLQGESDRLGDRIDRNGQGPASSGRQGSR